jgi:hypothetical protein
MSLAPRLHDAVAMKKSTTHKLALSTQTIRRLTNETLGQIVGGNLEPTGFIMKDTVIVRTSSR